MHVLFKRIRNLDIPIDLQLYLFDHVILTIALYGFEIWGFENSQIIENLHNDFLRQIINLRKSTPIYMLHAELGRHPIQIKNDRFLVINCQWKRIQIIKITVLNNA